MFINEIFREVINQFRSKFPLDFRYEMDNRNRYETRRSVKGLLPIRYSQTITKSKSLKNTLRKGCNWLTSMDLLPSNLTTLTNYQTKRYLKTICNLYIKDSQDLKNLFFNWILLKRVFFFHLAIQTYFFQYLVFRSKNINMMTTFESSFLGCRIIDFQGGDSTSCISSFCVLFRCYQCIYICIYKLLMFASE